MLKSVLTWLIQSSWFHKYAGMVGAFAAGLWVASNYWRQIRDTLAAWGVSREEYTGALLLIVSASGIAASISGTILKNRSSLGETARGPDAAPCSTDEVKP